MSYVVILPAVTLQCKVYGLNKVEGLPDSDSMIDPVDAPHVPVRCSQLYQQNIVLLL
jgi:hypothetical protein